MRALLLVPLLALAACDTLGPYDLEEAVVVDGVALTTDPSAYASDDEVTLTLRNRGRRQAETSVLGCAGLERRTDTGWTADLAINRDRYCILILLSLAPGDAIEGSVLLDGVDAGTYRFVHEVGGDGVATASFTVR